MSYTEDELWDMLRESADMPYGGARTTLTEQVIRHADELHATELRFKARLLATNAYVYGGQPAKSFVTFAWCLAEYDRDPRAYRASTQTLLWKFKATVSGLIRFPDIPLDRTYEVLDDMARRWRDGGHSPHAVYQLRHMIARHLGDRVAAEEWFDKWCAAPRDELSDCVGCDPTEKAAWLTEIGRHAEAIAVAEPVVDGDLDCSEQPRSILTALMVPYLRTGRLDEARDAHRRAYRAHRPIVADLAQIGQHVEFCARTGNESRGLEIVERHLGWLDMAPSPYAAMVFAAQSANLLRRAATAGVATAKVRRPAFEDRAADDVEVKALADELAALANNMAARFDARNGNDIRSAAIASTLAAEPLVDYLPISPTAGASAHIGVARVTPGGPARSEATISINNAALTDDLGPDALLDLAETWYREEHVASAEGACEAFDSRYGMTELTPRQRGRRAELYGLASANNGELAVAELAWMSALDLFAMAGDEVSRQITRSRIAQLMCRTDRAGFGLPIAEDATDYVVVHGPIGRRASAYRRLAFCYMLGGRVDDALHTLDAAEPYAAVSDDTRTPMWLLVDRAGILGETGQIDAAHAAAEQARNACRTAGFWTGLAAASWISGRANEIGGRLSDALAAYDEALGVCDDVEMRRQLRRQRGAMLAGTGRAAEAIDDLVASVADATAAGDREAATTLRQQLATAYLNSGRPLDSADVAEEAVASFADHDPNAEAVRHLLAQAYRALDQPDQAIEQLELVAASGGNRDCPELVGEMNEQIGDMLDVLDRDAAAALRYAAAADAYRRADLTLEHVRASRRSATSLMWANQFDAAVEALAGADLAALSLISDDPDVVWERAILACDGGRVIAAQGDLSGGILRMGPAIDVLRSVGDTGAATFAAGIYADLLLRADRPEEVERVINTALCDVRDEGTRQHLASMLVRALEAQHRDADAAAVRDAYQLGA
jgi:tetratricopeptide (TPR) repeat protein